ncbi:MAG TPA: xanthine dehydrogenase family protein subunit M [Ktedonobacteraceae bacterium]|nr:xanthine dehydrogenase family protein subunit M [Ktedonobacteraceae bacterium]
MKPPSFCYLRAGSVEEAVEALARSNGEAKILAGGQSLVPMLNLRLAQPDLLVDITRIASLTRLELDSQRQRLLIGAAVTQSEVEKSALVRQAAPLLAEALYYVAHPAIRNRGTLVGNAVHADPASEVPAVLLALGAEFIVVGPGGERTIAAGDFYVSALTTALKQDEIVTRIEIPVVQARSCSCWLEVARTHGNYALVGAGCRLECDAATIRRARIALCCVADTPVRALAAEAELAGRSITDGRAVERAAEVAALNLRPPGDIHASAIYRSELATTLTRRALNTALSRLNHDPVME